MPRSSTPHVALEEVAGNGLLHRRIFLTHGVALPRVTMPNRDNFILAYPPGPRSAAAPSHPLIPPCASGLGAA